MSEQWNALPSDRTLLVEQEIKDLAMKLHLTLAQANGLVARFGGHSDKLDAAAKRLRH